MPAQNTPTLAQLNKQYISYLNQMREERLILSQQTNTTPGSFHKLHGLMNACLVVRQQIETKQKAIRTERKETYAI